MTRNTRKPGEAVAAAIARVDLSAVYVVSIEGEPYRVTGSRAYCERRRADAIAAGRKTGEVVALNEADNV